MKVHKTQRFQIVFCDAGNNLFPPGYTETPFYPLDMTRPPYEVLTQIQQPDLYSIVLLKQTHSSDGFCVKAENLTSLLTAPRHEGDFLCTALPGIGIGVLTADCLPMALYDPVNHVAAIVHAGWRGTVDGIGVKTLQSMYTSYGTRPEDVHVFLGPCAKTCCYQVSEDFVQQLASFLWVESVIDRRDNKLFFNLPRCNSLLLQDAGVRPASISSAYNECTICNTIFCSYRRDASASCRQLAFIVLS